MSKANSFRRFTIWNRQLPDTALAGSTVVVNPNVKTEPAPIESSALTTVIDRPPTALPEPKPKARNLPATTRVMSAPPSARPPVPMTTNYLTTAEAAGLCRLSVRTLERYRVSGGGPLFTKCGPGRRARVVYRRTDLDA